MKVLYVCYLHKPSLVNYVPWQNCVEMTGYFHLCFRCRHPWHFGPPGLCVLRRANCVKNQVCPVYSVTQGLFRQE